MQGYCDRDECRRTGSRPARGHCNVLTHADEITPTGLWARPAVRRRFRLRRGLERADPRVDDQHPGHRAPRRAHAGLRGRSGWKVKTIAVGSGQAMTMGRRRGRRAARPLAGGRGRVHDKASPDPAARHAQRLHDRRPAVRPGGHQGGRPVDALADRATASTFISRGDDSGTQGELELWEAGKEPAGTWYQETGQGMGATLQIADQKGSYTLTDRGTYLAK